MKINVEALKAFWCDEEGLETVEYAVAGTLIATLVAAQFTALRTAVVAQLTALVAAV
jgi:Flp pilus assembly pilin Flp